MNVSASRRATAVRRKETLSQAVLVAALAIAALPLMTTGAAFQDMTSLLEGGKAEARWQAFFVQSPAGSIEKSELAFAGRSVRDRLPAGAGMRGGDGQLFLLDAPPPVPDTPDEARVSRADKTGRVLAMTPGEPAPVVPPKAFTAGSILERQSMLSGTRSNGDGVRTAFAIPERSDGLVALAMNFAATPAPGAPEAEAKVQVASLPQGRPDKGARLPSLARPAAPQALAYAAAELAENPASSLFSRILRPGQAGFIPPIGEADHAWAATPLPPGAYSSAEQTCLATAVYFEARGESVLGQAAVAQVILNRVRNPTYPKTICGVVYQNRNWHNRCQFSFACDGSQNRIYNMRAFAKAKVIAEEVTNGETWNPDVGSATHYHATYVRPRWASAMEKVDRIGRHIFYRTFGGGWD